MPLFHEIAQGIKLKTLLSWIANIIKRLYNGQPN